jgi:hypothetical protein
VNLRNGIREEGPNHDDDYRAGHSKRIWTKKGFDTAAAACCFAIVPCNAALQQMALLFSFPASSRGTLVSKPYIKAAHSLQALHLSLPLQALLPCKSMPVPGLTAAQAWGIATLHSCHLRRLLSLRVVAGSTVFLLKLLHTRAHALATKLWPAYLFKASWTRMPNEAEQGWLHVQETSQYLLDNQVEE